MGRNDLRLTEGWCVTSNVFPHFECAKYYRYGPQYCRDHDVPSRKGKDQGYKGNNNYDAARHCDDEGLEPVRAFLVSEGSVNN